MTVATNGKGSSPRPYSKPLQVLDLRRDLIWGTDKEKHLARLKLVEMGEIKDDTGESLGE